MVEFDDDVIPHDDAALADNGNLNHSLDDAPCILEGMVLVGGGWKHVVP